MKSKLQHNQFVMALGATYPDSPADNDLFVALGEKIQEGVALLHLISASKRHGITAEELLKIWMC